MRVRTLTTDPSLPHTEQVRHPLTWPLYTGQRLSQVVMRRRYNIRVHGAEHVPADGAVLICSNHIGVLDGPLVAMFSPRPVHVLTKSDVFVGRTGAFLRFAGQISVRRGEVDPAAVKTGLKVLRAGHALGVFPEASRGDGELDRFEPGVAYFALVTGAPVVPVAIFGTRLPGQDREETPPHRAPIDLVFGPGVSLPAQPWPRTREEVRRASAFLQDHMRAHLATAKSTTGLDTPGPLP